MHQRKAKKAARALLAMVLIIPIAYFSLILFVGPTLNNIKAASIEKELLAIPLPPETEVVETATYCGNTAGAGNHIEIWAGVLIRSTLMNEEISQFYQAHEIVWEVPTDENEYPEPRDYMKFPYLSANGNRENCYIIADHYTPATKNDIRGY